MRKVLYVSHNHSSIRPGGLETYTDELYQAIKGSGTYDPLFVARAPSYAAGPEHAGTRFAIADEDPCVYYIYTRREEFDNVFWSARDKRLHTADWANFLRVVEPDVVHFQQSAWLGYDMLWATRSALPLAPIVYTLHEFVPICRHDGQMVRRGTDELCDRASPRRCHQCFPEIPVQTFYLRERFIKSALQAVDLFIAPSEQLRRRYIEWGLPAEKIRYEDNGRVPVTPLPDPPDAGRRRRVGFFGQITRFKGVDVLLEAMKILERERAGVQLLLRGANLEFQTAEFQARIRQLLDETSESVRVGGRYGQDALPRLLSAVDWVVVPSIWWENAPLVIQEAMMHRRPVICSDIGGMAEKVRDGVDGLHFRRRDPHSLADTIRLAVSAPELWDRLHREMAMPHAIDDHVATLIGIYDELITQRLGEAAA